MARLIKLQWSSVKRVPLWLRMVLAAMVLIVALALIAPYFLDADRYRALLAGTIEIQTGRKVTIGKMRARLLPRAGVVVEGFRLGNAPNFAAGDLLSADAIRVNLAWWPLLRREVQVSSIELVRPKFVLLEDDRGETNYFWRGNSTGDDPPASAQPGAAATSAWPLATIERLELTDADVTLARVTGRARTVAPAWHAQRIRAELTNVVLRPLQPRQWQGDLPLAGVLLELPGWKSPLEFRSGRLKLREGRIESEFRLRMGKAGEFQGTLRVANIERPQSTFDLSASRLNVDRLLALRAAAPPSVPPGARPAGSELVAQGHLAADRLDWQSYQTGRGAADIRIFTDRLELWPVAIELYGGTLQISARADRTQSPERFSANVQVRNLDVGKLSAASSATFHGKLSGTGELDLQLFGSLGPAWQRSLAGTGRFTIRDGRLPGLDLAGALESLAKMGGVAGETPFNVIEGDLAIRQGRIGSRRIHMDSPRGLVDLAGSFGLDSTLDYTGRAVLNAGGAQSPMGEIAGVLGSVLKREVGRMTIPFRLRGTFARPRLLSGAPGIAVPASTLQPASPLQQQQKKSILDIFRRP